MVNGLHLEDHNMNNFIPFIAVATLLITPLFSAKELPETTVGFRKIQLLDKYVSEGASIGDINADGMPDIVAGPLWWQGPDFKKSFSCAPVKFSQIQGPGLSGYSSNFFTFPDDINNDKWIDILKVGLPGQNSQWAVNPGEKPFESNNAKHSCKHCQAQDNVCNESPQYLDVIGDEKKELLAFSRGHITLAVPNENEKWKVFNISPKGFGQYEHGLGVGDINGDGLTDILVKKGWWEQPRDWDQKTHWKHHPYPFAPQQGGAQMFAYDVDGDGDNDVVTALNAHKYGLAWYEQVKSGAEITFKAHKVMGEKPTDNPYGVCFSQPHAMDCVDIDGDGIKDIVTGKCFFAHNGNDPGAKDPAVLYWFRTVRHKDGSAELVPYKIDDDSGVGRQISTGDINGDGKADIVVSNKKGVFAFIQTKVISSKKKTTKVLPVRTFEIHGKNVKYGGSGFMGWWYNKDSVVTVPFTAKSSESGVGTKSLQYTIAAKLAAASHAGGGLKIVFSEHADPKKQGISTIDFEVKPTDDWEVWRADTLGSIMIPKEGSYYLHFIMSAPFKREFMNLHDVSLSTEEFPTYTIIAGPRVQAKIKKKTVKKYNALNAELKSGAEELKTFKLADGFIAELVSSEQQGTAKPISIAFDGAGRLWTQTAKEYPKDKNPAAFRAGGKDAVIVFDTPWAKGLQTPRVFADNMVMPVSVLPHDKGVYVIHGPDLQLLEDTNMDGFADKRTTLISDFGVQDTHTTAHQLTRSAGGWLNFTQGVSVSGNLTLADGKKMPFNRALIARAKPDGKTVEIIGAGMNNIWAWAINRKGRTFIHEANDFGMSQVPFDRDATYASFVKMRRYPDSFLHPPTAIGLELGGTGFSGIAISEDEARGFPKAWQNVHFVANPITGAINTVSYTLDEKGIYKFKKLPNLLESSDQMFRPVAIEFGPDGCLYVADWYNRVISHNEVSVDHPARDKVSGRIWRIRHKSQKEFGGINVEKAATKNLLKHLMSGNTWESRAAWHQIEKRQAKELIPQLKKNLSNTENDIGVRVHAIWALESLGYFDKDLWSILINDTDEHIRFEAVRALSTLQPSIDETHALLSNVKETSFYVLNEIVRYYRDTIYPLTDGHKEFLKSMRTPTDQLPNGEIKGWKGFYKALGGNYEKSFLNLLIQKALEREKKVLLVDEAKWNATIATNPPKTKEEKQKIQSQIEHFTKVFAKAKSGDIAKGKAHFRERCASCHSIDSDGKGFAPALNGGKKRDAEALITAILDPNAAAEVVFNVYRIIKKDGSTVEGFRSDLTATHITLTYMGGTSVKIAINDIKEAGYISGKSVMLENMASGLTDVEMVDLISYIQSIK